MDQDKCHHKVNVCRGCKNRDPKFKESKRFVLLGIDYAMVKVKKKSTYRTLWFKTIKVISGSCYMSILSQQGAQHITVTQGPEMTDRPASISNFMDHFAETEELRRVSRQQLNTQPGSDIHYFYSELIGWK